MDCPRCRLSNHPSAQRCDCGFDFTTQTVEQSYLQRSGRPVHGGYLARLTTTDGRMSRTSFAVFHVTTGVVVAIWGLLVVVGPRGGAGGAALIWPTVVLGPALAVTWLTTLVQRLHDAGHSGYWALLGSVVVLYCLVANSDRDNEYGPASSAW